MKHVYAVGPLENLSGEVTVWDGKPLISKVSDRALTVDNALVGKASFLVYGQAEAWTPIQIGTSVDLDQFDEFVKQHASRIGLDTNRPFPFLIFGVAKDAKYHVMHGAASLSSANDTKTHEQAKMHFSLENTPVQLLGFYSEHHQGIFTHHSKFVHVHVKAQEDRAVGHLEAAHVLPGARLLLPVGY